MSKLNNIKILNEFPMHRSVLQKALNIYENDKRIHSIYIGGTIATGKMDFYSDIDLKLVIYDKYFNDVFLEKEQIKNKIDNAIFSCTVDHLPFGKYMFIIIYNGPIKLEIDYKKYSEIIPCQEMVNYIIIKDTDNFLSQMKQKSKALKIDNINVNEINKINQKFWTWVFYVFGKIIRGELWTAFDYINFIRKMAIIPLIYYKLNIKNEGYRYLNKKIDNELNQELIKTIPILNKNSLYVALMKEVEIFNNIKNEINNKSKLSFDSVKEQCFLEELKNIWVNSLEK